MTKENTSTTDFKDFHQLTILDLFLIFRSNKKLIFSCFSITVLSFIIYMTLSPDIFTSHSHIVLGKTNSSQFIEDPDIFYERIAGRYNLNNLGNAPRGMPFLKNIKCNHASGVVKFSYIANSSKEAQDGLSKLIHDLMSELNLKMTAKSQLLEAQLEKIQSDIKLFKNLPISSLGIFKEEEVRLKKIISAKRPSEVLLQPTLPHSRTSPKRTLLLLLGIGAGVVLSLLSALMMQLFEEVKRAVRKAG